jgi:precorrin-4/cobalt-precorrin-4 C11-methyltransferase
MVFFVGAGPGAKDLITLRGYRLIHEADTLIYAGSLVNPELVREAPAGCRLFDSAKMTLDEVLDVIYETENAGGVTVRLHSGDPSFYGAIREQIDALEARGIAFEVCPGVSALFGAAASLHLEYTLPEVAQSVIVTRAEGRTKLPERETIQSFARHRTTMVLYLSSGLIRELQDQLLAGGYQEDTPAAIVYRATWPDEKIIRCTVGTLKTAAERAGITRQSLVIVGDVLAPEAYAKSKLYDPSFATGFRGSHED